VNLDGFDAWVEKRTAFMHLKTVKPKTSARKGVVSDDVANTEEMVSAAPDTSQPATPVRSKINNSAQQESFSRSSSSVASNTFVRGVSNVSSLSSVSSLQKAMKNGRSESGYSKEDRFMRTSCPDPKRSGTAHAVTSPGKLRSKLTPRLAYRLFYWSMKLIVIEARADLNFSSSLL